MPKFNIVAGFYCKNIVNLSGENEIEYHGIDKVSTIHKLIESPSTPLFPPLSFSLSNNSKNSWNHCGHQHKLAYKCTIGQLLFIAARMQEFFNPSNGPKNVSKLYYTSTESIAN